MMKRTSLSFALLTAIVLTTSAQAGMPSTLSKFRDMVKQNKLDRVRRSMNDYNSSLQQEITRPAKSEWQGRKSKIQADDSSLQMRQNAVQQMNAPADLLLPSVAPVTSTPIPVTAPRPKPAEPSNPNLQILVPHEGQAVARDETMVLVEERALAPLMHVLPREEETDLPPLRIAFEQLVLDGGVEGNHARIHLRLDLRIFGKGWVTVPLNLGEAVLERLELDGKAAAAVAPAVARAAMSRHFPGSPVNEPVGLLVGQAGPHVVEAVFRVPVQRSRGRSSLNLSLPRATATRVVSLLPGTGLRVTAPAAIETRSQEEKGKTRHECSLPPIDRLELAWAEASEATAAVRPRPVAVTGEEELRPVVNVESLSSFVWQRGILTTDLHLQYRVFRKAVDRLRFSIPASLDLLELRDPSDKVTRSYRKERVEGRDRVEVFLPAPQKGSFSLTVRLDRDMRSFRKKAGALAVTRFALPDCRPEAVEGDDGYELQRHEAYLSVAILDELRSKIALQEAVSPLPKSKLPPFARKVVPAKVWGIFRCLGSPWRLGLSLNERARAETTAYEIARADVLTVLTDQKKSLTRILYQVKNSKRQFMRLHLPGGSHIQSVFVAGKPVKPGLEDPKDPERLLIALERSQSSRTVDELQPFPVELTYLSPAGGLRAWGRLEQELARPEAQVREIAWRVYLPDGFHFTGLGGDFRDDPAQNPATSSAYLQGDDSRSVPTSITGWDKGGLISQVQSFSNVDRSPAPHALGKVAPRKATGRFPVRIEPIPTSSGRAFRCGVVPEDDGRLRKIRLFYARSSLVAKAGHVFCVLIAFFTLLFFLRLGRKERLVVPLVGLVISLLGAFVLDDGFPALRLYREGLEPALATGVGLALLYGICTPFRRSAARRAAAAAATLLILAVTVQAAEPILVPYPEKGLVRTLGREGTAAMVPRRFLEERERLDAALKAQQERKDAEEKTRPPVDVLFSDVRCRAEVLDGQARLVVQLELELLRDGWQEIEVLAGDLALDEVTVDGKKALITAVEDSGFLQAEMKQNRIIVADLEQNEAARPVTRVARKTRFRLRIREKGRHAVRIPAVATVEARGDGSHRFALDLPPAPLRDLELSLTGLRLGVQVQGSVETTARESNGRTELSARLATRGELAVSWYRKAETGPLRPGPDASPRRTASASVAAGPVLERPKQESKKPWIMAELFTRAAITETSLEATVAARIQVAREGISTLHFAVPKAFDVLELRGASGRPHRFRVLKTDDERKLVELSLPAKSTLGTVEAVLTGQLRRDPKAGSTVVVPRIWLMGVPHQRGWVAVEREGTMELETRKADGLRSVALERVPALWRPYARPDRLYRLFAYENEPWLLDLAVRKHGDLIPVQAVIDQAIARTELSAGGTGTTHLTLRVRNVSRDALRIRLPEGVKRLDAASVRGKAVRPVQGDDGWLELPLERPEGEANQTAPFEIKLRWNLRYPAWGMNGRFGLTMPTVDLPVLGSGFTWNLHCSDGDRYRLTDFGSAFEWMRRRDPFCPVSFLAPAAQRVHDYQILRRLVPWFEGGKDRVWQSVPEVKLGYVSRNLDLLALLLTVFTGLLAAFSVLAMVAGGKGAMTRAGWSRARLLFLLLASLFVAALVESALPGQARRFKYGLMAGSLLFFLAIVRWRVQGVFTAVQAPAPEGGDRA